MNNLKTIFRKTRKIFENIKSKDTLSLQEQIHFASRLSFLLKSGMPVLQSLILVQNQTKNKKQLPFYKKIVSDVSQGRMLSQSLKPFLSDFAWSLIDSGEQNGFLSTNLYYLSCQLSRRREMVKKIWQAFIYPSFIALATLGITVFLILYIFPKILPVIKSLNVELPLATKAIINLSTFLTHYWIHSTAFFILVVFCFVAVFKNSREFKFFLHHHLLGVPIFGKIYRDFLLANFCRNLSLLLHGHLSIDRALNASGLSMMNIFLRSQIFEIRDFVIKGGKLGDSLLSKPKVFPEVLSQMVAVGEQTANLPDIFSDLAEFYESEFSEKTRNLSQTLEPLLLIIAGFIVGLVAISIITPIYEITQNLQRH